jgi:hypothetical protein
MVGDTECMDNSKYATSVQCMDQEAHVLCVSKADFLKLQEVSEDTYKEIKRISEYEM